MAVETPNSDRSARVYGFYPPGPQQQRAANAFIASHGNITYNSGGSMRYETTNINPTPEIRFGKKGGNE